MKLSTVGLVAVLVTFIHGTYPLDVRFSVVTDALFENETSLNPQDSIADIATTGAQYINVNTTFLTRKYKLINISPSAETSGAADTVYKCLLDICNHVTQSQLSAIIVTRGKCPASEDIAGVASNATNPIMAIDIDSYGGGSRAFKMYPSAEDMNNFFIEVLSYFQWRNFMLLYDDKVAYSNLRGMINYASNQEWNITSIRLSENLADIFDNITNVDTPNIFIFCSSEAMLKQIINQALELELLGPNFAWIVGNLNAIQLNDPILLRELENNNAYITHFQMNYTREIQYYLPLTADYLTWNLRSKFTFDSVVAFAFALKSYRLTHEGDTSSVFPGDTILTPCQLGTNRTENPISSELRNVAFEGLTGSVAFNENGDRVNYTISILSGQGETLEQLRGEWTQNIDFWEDKWNTPWKGEGRLNLTGYNFGLERKIRNVSFETTTILFNYQTTTILYQGYDYSTPSLASRTLSGFSFWFSLVTIFLYIFNLTPFM